MLKTSLDEMRAIAKAFVQERDWEVYQTPKNLSIALSVECAELMEIFQWMEGEESREIVNKPEKMSKIRDELADIMHCLLRLCDTLDVDIEAAFKEKVEKNAKKYPVDLAKGRKEKYTEI